MTHNLILYWQRLAHRLADHDLGDHDERAEAPVLDLAACFANPVIAARQTAEVARLADAARGHATAR